MARVWMEGFEDGLPHGQYLEGTPGTVFMRGLSYSGGLDGVGFPVRIVVGAGRGTYSSKSMKIYSGGGTYSNYVAAKTLDTELSEFFFRVWFKHNITETTSDTNDVIWYKDTGGNRLLGIFSNTMDSFAVKVNIGGSYSSVGDFTMSANEWHKIDIYFKVDSSVGAYDVRIDGAIVYSATAQNTGTANVSSVSFGSGSSSGANVMAYELYYDDIALNDTSGSINNSWCGDGTIVSLKPKGNGNKSQWSTSQGFALAEDGTTTTNIEITGHGLSTNDVIYNVTRDAYRIVTVVDVNNLTVSSVTGQTQGDTIVAFSYVSTITAATGTSTSLTVLGGHTLESYDVTVNTTRSNAIRRAIFVNGINVYNSYSYNTDYTGSTVSSQASGDSIKTFKVKQYAISNHYQTQNQSAPNPQYANIQSSTSGHIDTFDMQELVADKLLPSNTGIIAVSHNIYAKEKGAGSQIKPVIRIGSTDYEGSAISLYGGTLQYQTVYSVSPATSSNWTLSEIDALEAGVEVV